MKGEVGEFCWEEASRTRRQVHCEVVSNEGEGLDLMDPNA